MKIVLNFRFLNDLVKVFHLAILAGLLLPPLSHGNARFEEAYFRLEANVFDNSVRQGVIAEFNAAGLEGNEDPWFYLCASLTTLVSGYKIGDWYTEKTFAPGTAERALELAEKAKSISPNLSQSHAHYARILILQEEYKKAWMALGRAHELDPDSFYPWYFRGIIAEKMRDAGRASGYFDEAEQRVAFDHQQNLVNIHRQKVARFSKDLAEQERLLKENIKNNPESSTYHGNYAQFLKEQKRYQESLKYWEKAVELGPSPNALKKLEEVRRLLNENLQ
ncbi:hypothetical protein [Microbulbifer sp.]|uniref:hypothetical protein n=1 Tax=Microbulbifer sp. TaxID=1908541 RepID=UPI003F37D0C9